MKNARSTIGFASAIAAVAALADLAQAQTTTRVSVDSSGKQVAGGCAWASISADGRFVAFQSSSATLVSGDTNKMYDAFVHDRATGTTERVSVDSSGAEGNGNSFVPRLSADGRFVVFESSANNLVPGDTNFAGDVFVRDRGVAVTERMSVDSSGAEGNDFSDFPAVSADGKLVTCVSQARNLVPLDTNGRSDLFLHDRVSAQTERISVDSAGVEGNGNSTYATISGNGHFVAFDSAASNLVAGDTNGATDSFVRERSGYASWISYGIGHPGSLGVPNLVARQDPVLGTTLTLDLDNSYGSPTGGLLFVGFTRATIHSGWGGDLLVLPLLALGVNLPANGASFTGLLPSDPSLVGVTVDLQALEADPGASRGVSFTPGLELVLGS